MAKQELGPVNRQTNLFVERAGEPAASGYHPSPSKAVTANTSTRGGWRDEPTLSVKVPPAVAAAIEQMMFERKLTKRAVVLDLLRRGGLEVPGDAIADRRKAPRKLGSLIPPEL